MPELIRVAYYDQTEGPVEEIEARFAHADPNRLDSEVELIICQGHGPDAPRDDFGLTITMSPDEARTLARQLVDAAAAAE